VEGEKEGKKGGGVTLKKKKRHENEIQPRPSLRRTQRKGATITRLGRGRQMMGSKSSRRKKILAAAEGKFQSTFKPGKGCGHKEERGER